MILPKINIAITNDGYISDPIFQKRDAKENPGIPIPTNSTITMGFPHIKLTSLYMDIVPTTTNDPTDPVPHDGVIMIDGNEIKFDSNKSYFSLAVAEGSITKIIINTRISVKINKLHLYYEHI